MSEGIIIKSDGNKTLAQIQAEVAAFEANPVDPGSPDITTPPAVVANAPAAPTEKAATPAPGTTPPAEEPAKPAQQPQETAEKVASETPKVAEPVKATDWEAAYKGLQTKYNKAFVEKKEGSQEAAKPIPPAQDEHLEVLSPEFKQKFVADLERDPVDALVKLNRAITRQEVMPIKSKFDAAEARQLESARWEGLDNLVKEGHEWLKTEDGLRKMETVFNDNPELWKTRDPYRAALGFIPDVPSKAGQRGPAQSTGLTPMLGVSGAMPPTVSAPAVSKMAKLESLQVEVMQAQSRGQWDKAKQLLDQMGEVERGY